MHSVWVFEEKVKGIQTQYESAYIDYQLYELCTGAYSYGYGDITGAAFDINRLQRATLDGSGSLQANGRSREATVSGSFTIDGLGLDLDEGYGSLSQTSSGSFEIDR